MTTSPASAPPTFEHAASFPLPAPPDRAFRALIEPAQLAHWFAEHVAVEPRVGGAFRFHGRATLGTPDEASATQTITALEPGRSLELRWALHGVDTTVRWDIAPDDSDPAASKLAIRHTVRGALPYQNARHVIDDLWRLHAGNLMAHLRGDGNVVLPDLTSAAPEVRLTIEIAAPPAKVYRALLDPTLMKQWLGGAPQVDVANRTMSFGWSYEHEGRAVAGGPTQILELVENHKLVTDWGDWRGDPTKPATRLTWLLEPLDAGARTRLTLVHDGFAQPVDRSDYQQGWGWFADELRKVAEAS